MRNKNELIAKFMGLELHEHQKGLVNTGHGWYTANYDTSWKWLMPVVEKIDNWLFLNIASYGYFDECLNSNKIEVKYNAVIDFIEWYNKLAVNA